MGGDRDRCRCRGRSGFRRRAERRPSIIERRWVGRCSLPRLPCTAYAVDRITARTRGPHVDRCWNVFAGGIGGDVLLRLALAPTALVAIAAKPSARRPDPCREPNDPGRVGDRHGDRCRAGWYRYSVMVIGALTMASVLAERRSTSISSDRVRLGVGGGMRLPCRPRWRARPRLRHRRSSSPISTISC